jgi:transposase-like protein
MRMNLIELTKKFASDDRCREFLERLRWPNGPECPRCKNKDLARLSAKLLWCGKCEYQFGVTVGSVFQDSHLPLLSWFTATLLLCEAKKGISACQIQRTLGIGSYRTAWYLCHRIRSAMKEADRQPLKGTVEMDEMYLGGRAHGKRGRGAAHKEVVIGIRQRQGELRFFHAEDVRTGTLEKYIRENISDEVDVLMTDDLGLYYGAARHLRKQRKHKTIHHRAGYYVNGDIHTNTVESAFSLLQRGLMGTWHRLSAKHLASYLQEMEFRFNRRKNPNIFIDTLRQMINAPVLPLEKLTDKAA